MEECKGSDVVGRTRLDDEEETKLLPQDARRFRSIAARCNFLAADRIDIQFACKEVCRGMSAPCESDWKMLKSIARYLRSHPRVMLQYKYQDPPPPMEAIVDTDFAGCRRTRKSTNGGCVMHGMHLIKSWATTQTVIAMSSGEAEYFGVVKGACEAIGVVSLLRRFDWPSKQCTSEHRLQRGSRYCHALVRRESSTLGSLNSLATRPSGSVSWSRSPRSRVKPNVADVCTKYLDGRKLRDMLSILPLCFEHGRHALAPQLHGQIQTLMPDDCTNAHRPKGGCEHVELHAHVVKLQRCARWSVKHASSA